MHLYLFLPVSRQSFENFWTFLRKSIFFAEKSLREYPRTSLWFEVAVLTTFEETKVKKKTFLAGQQFASKNYEIVKEYNKF